MEHATDKYQQSEFFAPKLRLLILIFLFITAFGIRLYRITDAPFDFYTMRQYHSLVIARGIYFESLETIPKWRKEIAAINKESQEFLEPRIIEYLAFLAYRLAGAEYIWIPRILSSIFWLVGGIFLYLLAKDLASYDAAIFSTAIYLFLPFGVSASRSIQPDPLMIMLFVASLFTIYRYHTRPSTTNLIIAGAVSGVAILVKMVCIFIIFAAFVSLNIYRHGFRKGLINANLVLFSALSLIPFTLFFMYGYFLTGLLKGQAQRRILPQLLLNKDYWGGWLNQIEKAVGYIALIGGILGIFITRNKLSRVFLIGLWAGYGIFGLAFTYHIYTHTYYQLQFIPIIALSLGPLCALVINYLGQNYFQWYWRLAFILVLLFAISLSLYKTRWRVINTGFEQEIKTAQDIGEIVNHSTKTIYLAPDYGLPLLYHGEISGVYWPQRGDMFLAELGGQQNQSAKRRLDSWISNYSAEYFIVTDFEEFEAQADLRDLLNNNFPVYTKNNSYIIFELDK